MPTVSVIVPVYNVEKYMYRCVDSILAQTFTDFELILVDDGSPDNCPAICDQYAAVDPRIRVLHLENGGVSKARNAGLDVATGTYIAFCDSDDWWDSNLLSCVMEENNHGNWDWVSFRFRKVDDSDLSHEMTYPIGEWVFENWNDKLHFLFTNFLLCRSGWEVWARMFKRDIIEQYGIRFCETCNNFAEDLGFCAKYLLCAQSIIALDNCLYNYYQRPNSMMASSKQTIKLNELNETSCDVGALARRILPDKVFQESIGILHYLIMYNQYSQVFFTEKYRHLPMEFGKIKRQTWFRTCARSTIESRNMLRETFGKENADRIVNFSIFCLHRNWYLYTLGRRMIDLLGRQPDG